MIWVVEWRIHRGRTWYPVGPWWDTEADAKQHASKQVMKSLGGYVFRVARYDRVGLGKSEVQK